MNFRKESLELLSVVLENSKKRPIESLIDQHVLVRGLVETWKDHENGQKRLLLKHVKLQDYEKNNPLIKLDHCWIFFSRQEFENMKRYCQDSGYLSLLQNEFYMCCKVVEYTRKNKSGDFGLKILSTPMILDSKTENTLNLINNKMLKISRLGNESVKIKLTESLVIKFYEQSILLINTFLGFIDELENRELLYELIAPDIPSAYIKLSDCLFNSRQAKAALEPIAEEIYAIRKQEKKIKAKKRKKRKRKLK